jgi:hypothetical protein
VNVPIGPIAPNHDAAVLDRDEHRSVLRTGLKQLVQERDAEHRPSMLVHAVQLRRCQDQASSAAELRPNPWSSSGTTARNRVGCTEKDQAHQR